MRSFVMFLCVLCALSACQKRTDVWIEGEVKGLRQSEVLVYGFRADSNEMVKEIPVEEGIFTCALLPDSIWPVRILLDGDLEIPVFCKRGDAIKIKGDMRNWSGFRVEGGDEINEALNTWRNNKALPEAFIEAHPDHPASAWVIWNEALTEDTLNTTYLTKLLRMVTPRITDTPVLSPLKKELERSFARGIELPFFSREAHVVLRHDGGKIDTVLTHGELLRRTRSLMAP